MSRAASCLKGLGSHRPSAHTLLAGTSPWCASRAPTSSSFTISNLCTRSHCAAHIDPLELLEHENVVVLSDTASPDSTATFHIHDMLRTRSARARALGGAVGFSCGVCVPELFVYFAAYSSLPAGAACRHPVRPARWRTLLSNPCHYLSHCCNSKLDAQP